jgi:hypothetical protein
MNNSVESRFEVTDHYELPGRGAFLIGNIMDGTLRIGMSMRARDQEVPLTISRIEYVDHRQLRRFANALTFHEQPSLDYLKKTYPLGSVVTFHDQEESGQANQAL